jgi:DNA modification methylase
VSYNVLQGDCRIVLAEYPENHFDSAVIDAPYGLSKEPDVVEVLRHWLAGDDFKANGAGFMGKSWDSFVPGPATWREVLRTLKPGAYAAIFAGSRTQDLMAMSLRLAGFEIRDTALWIYGSGFPKSLDISKAVDARLGAEREKVRTPMGTTGNKYCKGLGDPRPWMAEAAERGYHEHDSANPVTAAAAAAWEGWGTALKPAYEPIIIARKPMVGTVADNVLTWGVGGINVDGCRVAHEEECRMMSPSQANIDNPSEKHRQAGQRTAVLELKPNGRWPANILHDGSDEVVGLFPDAKGQQGDSTDGQRSQGSVYGAPSDTGKTYPARIDSTTSAARFFYCAKASKADRNEGLGHLIPANHHPTVKPTDLMRWVVRLVTPPGGRVLDAMAGSGSTGKAAILEGFEVTLIDSEPDYIPIIEGRCAAALVEYLEGLTK